MVAASDQLTRPSRRSTTSAITIPIVDKSMAVIVGMEPDEPERIIRAITYACPSCEFERCRRCEGTGFLAADVDDWEVDIDGVRYDRGIETNERIARALESVDEECREDLEWLLRHGPSNDVDSPAMQAVIARAEREPRAVIEPIDIVAHLREEMRRAVQDSALPFREKSLAMAKLGPGGGK